MELDLQYVWMPGHAPRKIKHSHYTDYSFCLEAIKFLKALQ